MSLLPPSVLLFGLLQFACTAPTVPDTEAGVRAWYLGANRWAVRVNDRLLIFDYQDWTDPNPPAPGRPRDLQHGYINPAALQSLDVYVFVSHAHLDHFDPAIYEWQEELDRIEYFFGWEAGDNPDHHYMVPQRAHTEVNGVWVYTIYDHPNDVPEVAYLVMVDGHTIYHNGDYRGRYIEDSEYLRTITDHIDIAFVVGQPVEEHQHFWQAVLLDQMFHPTCIFPTNREGESYRCHEYAELLRQHGAQAQVLVADRRGDSYLCPGGPDR